MQTLTEWAREQWDVLAAVAALALALTASGVLAVGYNVIAVRLERATIPIAIEAAADRGAAVAPVSSPRLAPSS